MSSIKLILKSLFITELELLTFTPKFLKEAHTQENKKLITTTTISVVKISSILTMTLELKFLNNFWKLKIVKSVLLVLLSSQILKKDKELQLAFLSKSPKTIYS